MVSYYVAPRPQSLPVKVLTADLTPEQAKAISSDWLSRFNAAVSSADASAFDSLFVEDESYWRDTVAFTSDFRSIAKPNIFQAATDRLAIAQASGAELSEPAPAVDQPFDDVAYVQAHFKFTTKIGPAVGIVKLLPVEGIYKAYILYTTLIGVHGHEEKIGVNRLRGVHNTKESYDEMLAASIEDPKPDVVIVGGGHNGLEIAARLRYMGVSALVIDKYKRVGDNWRRRYKSLSLHDPVYSNHLAYMPFPETWPIFTPSGKLANFLEYYADCMELKVWTESEIITNETAFDEQTKQWYVSINRAGTKRTFNVSHVIIATGIGGGYPKMPPKFKGQDLFKNKIVHSSAHGTGNDWSGKTALVVGACTSAHDISYDFYNNGAKVTMLQRSPTYVMSVEKGVPMVQPYSETGPSTWTVDLLAESVPKIVARLYHKRFVPKIAEADKDLLAGLEKAGFKLYKGMEDCGFFLLTNEKSGGYYYDTGCSPQIINGNIKIKGGEIDYFTEDSVVFKDGTSMKPDIVVFATGYTGFKDQIESILGPEYAAKFKPFWGLDEEGELRGTCRGNGVPNCYYVVGPLSGARFNSLITAVQVIAEREGLLGDRYTIEAQAKKSVK
ncbi:hypothetical protein V1511DRAFT_490638 [Dipodascopsis uninucleata]